MTSLRLKNLNLGKTDGKFEYRPPKNQNDRAFFDAFLIPNNIDVSRLSNSDIYIVEGFRGTGKTSLLRWFSENKKSSGDIVDFVLFKSELTEAQRIELSKEVGMKISDIDSKKMEISQDFKTAWAWFIHHKIGEMLSANKEITSPTEEQYISKYKKILGIDGLETYNKVLGFFPRLDGATVKIKADIPFFSSEFGAEFKSKENTGQLTLEAIVRKLNSIVKEIRTSRNLYIIFDELEVFYQASEQYNRDQRMVRDLVFCISDFNEIFRSKSMPFHIIAGVRSEVIGNLGPLGQEVERIVHDSGVKIAWHYSKRSLNHPLIEMIKRKIETSEKIFNPENTAGDPIEKYFPRNIDSDSIDAFLLDQSFYKPRDIVWRLTLAQKNSPEATYFSKDILKETAIEYSTKLWDEICYELGAMYSANDIACIELVLSGISETFDIGEIEERFKNARIKNKNIANLLQKKEVSEILSDLYRLGAIGNFFRVGPSAQDIKNRWSFRGDPMLLHEKKMTIHFALRKRLSVVSPRRRGSRGHQR